MLEKLGHPRAKETKAGNAALMWKIRMGSGQVVGAGWLHERQALVELPARAQADRPALLQALNSCLEA